MREVITKCNKQMISLLKKEGVYEFFRKLKRRYKRELQATIYISEDTCSEGYQGTLYQAEVFQTEHEPDLIFVSVCGDIYELLLNLEEYLNA